MAERILCEKCKQQVRVEYKVVDYPGGYVPENWMKYQAAYYRVAGAKTWEEIADLLSKEAGKTFTPEQIRDMATEWIRR